jgi:hypothetical protein
MHADDYKYCKQKKDELFQECGDFIQHCQDTSKVLGYLPNEHVIKAVVEILGKPSDK